MLKRTELKRGNKPLKRSALKRKAPLRASKSKYGAIRTELGGYTYASKLEATYAQQLELRKKAKDIKDWERQPQVIVYVYGIKMFQYKLDFKIIHNDYSEELVEVKGFPDKAFPLKWKVFTTVWNHEHPEVITNLLWTKDII